MWLSVNSLHYSTLHQNSVYSVAKVKYITAVVEIQEAGKGLAETSHSCTPPSLPINCLAETSYSSTPLLASQLTDPSSCFLDSNGRLMQAR